MCHEMQFWEQWHNFKCCRPARKRICGATCRCPSHCSSWWQSPSERSASPSGHFPSQHSSKEGKAIHLNVLECSLNKWTANADSRVIFLLLLDAPLQTWLLAALLTTLLYLIFIVTQFLFGEGSDSEVNPHRLLLRTTWRFILANTENNNQDSRLNLNAKGARPERGDQKRFRPRLKSLPAGMTCWSEEHGKSTPYQQAAYVRHPDWLNQ